MLSFTKLPKASRNDSLNDERGEMKGQAETQLLREHFPIKTGSRVGGAGLPSPSDTSLTLWTCVFRCSYTFSRVYAQHSPDANPASISGLEQWRGFPVLCGSQVFKNV